MSTKALPSKTVAVAAPPDRSSLIAVALAVAYLAALYFTAPALGYARDEGFYFHAARSYRPWFELLWQNPRAAFESTVIDRYWIVNHEHPSLMKVLFMASHRIFHEGLGWIAEPGTAYRLPGMLSASVAVATIYLWGRRVSGHAAGLVAAISFAAMPRVFFHAHLACFDVPVTAAWLVTSYCYVRSLETPRLRWYLATAVSYGLLLEIKHNAWLLPFVMIGHHVLLLLGDVFASRRPVRTLVPRAWIGMLLLGPLLFYALWPWLWFDPIARFAEYFAFHRHHDYYNMEFLGRTYWKPPMPLGYAWVMTAATVPLITLLLFVLGLIRLVGGVQKLREQAPERRSGPELFWLVAVLVSYAPWLYDSTPIFGGTKHWMTAYPFLCLLAGSGSAWLLERLGELRFGRIPAGVQTTVAGACLVAAPIGMTLHSHPFGLSFYTPLVGGAAGAATLGLNRTFWGYTTGSLAPALNRGAAPGAGVYVHDTALPSFEMLQADGRLRSDLRPTLAIQQSSLALYHHEPHMGRVEYQIWVEYGSVVPSTLLIYDGVPIVWLYDR